MQPLSHIVSGRILTICWASYRRNFCRNTLGMKVLCRIELQRPIEIVRNSSNLLHRPTPNLEENNLEVDIKLALRKIVECVGIDEETLNEAFHKEPRLVHVHLSLWESSFKALRTCGFSGKECLKMFIAAPTLFKTKPDVLLLGMKNWQSTTALGDEKLISLFTSCPQLLFVELQEIKRRIPVLKSLSSQKDCVEFLRQYPDLMLVDWSDFLAKVNYVEEVMKINRRDISKCDLLSCSLLELKTRHVFLERTGNYVPKNPKLPEHLQNKNPSLRQIVDSDDISFATKVAGLTLEEFEVFRDVYKEELNESGNYSDSD